MESRKKKAGLTLSAIGVFLNFLGGSIFLLFLSPTPIIQSVSLLFTGAISLLGIIIGLKEIKAGGVVILISIPISIVYMLILNFFLEGIYSFTSFEIFAIVLYPIPIPHSVFVIIGGILCLMGFDE